MSEIKNDQEIIELEFPYNVRIRPGMYLPNITHMITEIVDNSLDEFVGGHATGIAVYVQDGVVTVMDNGRGIPVTPPKGSSNGMSQLEIASTKLHGGKYICLVA